MDKRTRFYQIERGLAKVLNKWSVDNDFHIPDYILARYLMRQLTNLMDLNHELYKHRYGDIPGHNERISTTMADSGVEKKAKLGKPMSKTPRTDNVIITDNEYLMENIGLVDFVRASHARQLETELVDKDRQLAEARAEIERLKEKIKRCSTCKHFFPGGEMVEICLNEAHCCRTTAWRVIDRTTSAQRENWPDLWEEDR